MKYSDLKFLETEIEGPMTHFIPVFEDPDLNAIAEECGLVLPLTNLDALTKELEFFSKHVYNQGRCDELNNC